QFSKSWAEQVAQRDSSVAFSRLSDLLDPDSYVSLDSLVMTETGNNRFSRPPVAGDGVWTGSGTIDNRLVYVAAQDPAVYGGSMGQKHAAKIAKAIDLARAAGVPFIGLYESGGVRLEEGLAALEAVSDVLAALSAATGEIPLIAAVYGPCAGSSALMAGLSDVTILRADKAALSVNGPGVLAARTNQNLTPIQVGGTAIQGDMTGLAALSAATEQAMPAAIRKLLTYLPDTAEGFLFEQASVDDPNRCESALDTLAMDLDQGIDISVAIDLIFDQGSFLEMRAGYANQLVTGLARLDGQVVGLVAVSGARLSIQMTDKAIQLLQLCDRLAIPVITLLDTAGFELSLDAEKSGLLSAATRLFQTTSQAQSPRISVILGHAIGPVYVALASKGSGADLVLAWPTATLAAVPADTAAHILYRQAIAAAADPTTARAELADRFATEVASPSVAAGSGLIDEMIAPSATRPRLISALNSFA
ncbi:MAG: carboxyl transferase domain-containing protein, partial [Eubacteriales bacterium]|nr:carboxyl transferase domain-containing protein [Eubacteriales bacterium]